MRQGPSSNPTAPMNGKGTLHRRETTAGCSPAAVKDRLSLAKHRPCVLHPLIHPTAHARHTDMEKPIPAAGALTATSDIGQRYA